MTAPGKKPIFFSRPRDESLQAFKDWINDVAEKLTGKPAAGKMTEEEWEQKWREFWGSRSGTEKQPD